jgi:hypothetical protein
VHLDNLLDEHVFIVAKLAVAANAGRHDEFRSYAGLLAAAGGEVETLFRSAVGETAGAQFGDAWTEQNNYLVDYLVASSTHDAKASADAMSKLTDAYVPHAATVLASSLSLSSDAATRFATDHVTLLKAIIDDAASASYPQMYAAIAGAGTQAVAFGDAVAIQVARQFSDRFPGDPNTEDAGRRVNLNWLMHQQGYLMTMATDATVSAADAEAMAATASLASNANPLGTVYGGTLWLNETELVTAYAKSGDASLRQSVIGAAPPGLSDALTALLRVVDDQRGKQFASVAIDDHAMATALATAADEASLNPA